MSGKLRTWDVNSGTHQFGDDGVYTEDGHRLVPDRSRRGSECGGRYVPFMSDCEEGQWFRRRMRYMLGEPWDD